MRSHFLHKPLAVFSLLVCSLFVTSPLFAFLANPDFDQGADNLEGYGAFAVWFQPASTFIFASPYGLADAPVTADGGGTAVFGMNTQLAAEDAFFVGATQEMSFFQDLWTPDNTIAETPTVDLYGQTIVFSGFAEVTEAYAPGNVGQAFIQFIDTDWNGFIASSVDVSTLGPSGAFSLSATVPAGGLNIVQVGFRNSGIEGTAGQMTISGLSVVPEPGSLGLLALGALGIGMARRRRLI